MSMAEKVQFELVSPERLLVSKPVEMVVVPGAEGTFGVLARHAPLISSVLPGRIDVYHDDRTTISESLFVAGGFAEVTGERCTILAETAISPADIDTAAVEQAIRDLREDLADAKTDGERERVKKALAIEEAKLRVAKTA